MVEKRKTTTKGGNDAKSNKKNKIEQDNSIMALGMDDYDDEISDQDIEGAVSYNDKYYNGESNDNSESEDDDEELDYIDGNNSDDEEEKLDDSEAAMGRPTILPEKSEIEAKKFVNLKIKNVPVSQQSAAPTSDEIQNLKETQFLFNSNLFRLQINELFKEIKIDYSKLSSLESALHQIKTAIEKIPEQDVDITEDNISAVKLFDFNGGEGLSVHYSRPSSIDVVGSFMSRSVIKSNPNVDMTIEIPLSSLSSKDANDFKYFTKRNLYLLKVANELKKHPRFSDLSFKNFNDDSNKQIIVIKPKEDPKTGSKTKFQIRIIPTIPKELFNIYTKFNPNISCIFLESEKDNIKIQTFKENDSIYENNESKKVEDDSKTKKKRSFDEIKRSPFYNNSILEDILLNDHMQLINEKCENAPVLVDTMLLVKLWLDLKKIPTVNSFHLSMLLIHLYNNGRINKSMSSYQAFRMLMVFISKEISSKSVIFMKLSQDAISSGSIKQNQYFEEFEKLYPVALVDDTGLLNVWSSVSSWGLRQLILESRLVLENLDSGNGFEEIFMTKFHFYTEYDLVLKIILGKEELSQFEVPLNDYYQKESYLENRIYQLLRKSLTKRVTKVTIFKHDNDEYTCWKDEMPENVDRTLTVGIKVNTENWLSVIDLGPPADHVNSAKFREFWGAKSQVRRFKDGSILDAVTWSPKNGSRHLVIEEIVKYILNLHLKIPVTRVSTIVSELDSLIIGEKVQDQTLNVIAAKEKLIHVIGQLGLPLGIEAFSPISPALRYTDVLTSFDENYLENEPIQILLHFQTSQQWTKDVDSINALKTAFLLKMARELENTIFRPRLTEKYLDLQVDGFVFRLISYYPKEMEFMREQWKVEGLPELESLQRNSIHHTFIQSLHTTYSSYGPTTRIALRWIHSHLFSDFIDQQSVELLVGSLYKGIERDDGSMDSTNVPKTPLMGFLRFLFLLYTYNFEEQPLIIDFNNSIKESTIQEIKNMFALQKQSNNPPIIYFATDKDRNNQWFRHTTIRDQDQWSKIKLLAQKSIELIEDNFTNQTFNWLSIFEPSLFDFDAIFNLNEQLIPNHSKEILNIINNKKFNLLSYLNTNSNGTNNNNNNISNTSTSKKPVFKNIIKKSDNNNNNNNNNDSNQLNNGNNNNLIYKDFKPGFNPVVELINQLKDKFSEYCIFQYDLVGGNKITLKWKSQAFLPVPFKPSKSKYVTPISKDSNLVIPNIFEILNEIQMLGGKLIKSFKLNQNSNNLLKEWSL
ncbi:hypothetical protein DICPUDRAFT_154593 [Dictyostelium purpureum]|uniref:U3 small nucleolar RNA-associated protein 22 n=1 Tax=Dictyostelium purpureum TaxID=5786 RepID=F0ZRR2_DICPU|nr:uncharacterized protein DICPUDRAFT_154593 [Dictyostelium purpureum]EGC33351.1 hypothetical protein DICPUDRAFT_154593 [Dictyostelium purpureum]|eukprot:XP_003290102.1 hypothetical protein DICPUDRAFT_154593 [Dictyostelium purpureum]